MPALSVLHVHANVTGNSEKSRQSHLTLTVDDISLRDFDHRFHLKPTHNTLENSMGRSQLRMGRSRGSRGSELGSGPSSHANPLLQATHQAAEAALQHLKQRILPGDVQRSQEENKSINRKIMGAKILKHSRWKCEKSHAKIVPKYFSRSFLGGTTGNHCCSINFVGILSFLGCHLHLRK